MRILVTGGTGYIGSHTVVELQQGGFEVVIIDDLSNSYAGVVDNIEKITGVRPGFERIDLSCEEKVMDFFLRNNGISGVIHFAAFKAVGESVEQPLKYYRNNLLSLINVLKGMEMHGISPIVFSSSCTVYGQPDMLPVTENSPLKKAWSPYGHTKQVSEEIIANTASVTQINSILLRYFNPIGAHDSALIGELPIGIPNNLVPFITQTAIGKRECLSVFGNDYNTPDGTAVRDYIHVVDLAKAHVTAISRLMKSENRQKVEIFNIGTGNGFSVLEVIQSFERISGQKLNYRFAPRRPGDIEKVWADTALANHVLGWKTEKNLDDMMASAWKWEKSIRGKYE
ncbi:MAG: UDP-glucose 4-epimerase GalE [Bacteroidales bacterium]|nr:UDP-glucose 4-epimerase GalE [Bacteroidales bacterium]